MKKLNQLGQTSMEYMLMIAVAVTLGVAFKKKMEEYLFKNPNSFINVNLRQFRSLFNEPDPSGRPYKRFRVFSPRRSR